LRAYHARKTLFPLGSILIKTKPISRGAAGSHLARKRFGQHFLVDETVLQNIVNAIDPKPGDVLIEIGPGLGAMTQGLIERCGKLIAVELDRDLGPKLQARFGSKIELIQADALTVNFASLAPQSTALRIVGNLPYNISSPLLFHLMPHAAFVKDQVFMLQKEVVDRMVAKPSTKAYGRLSVMLQWRYAMTNVLHVPPTAFDPPPRVDSAVVRMVPHAQPPACDPAVLSSLVAAAFSQRRKILRHMLRPWLAEREITLADFNFQRRAEEVSVEEYVSIAMLARKTVTHA
jgi:16S rRNA (adenine1518-N6/adenine1519-N6)-dimethyltransferase